MTEPSDVPTARPSRWRARGLAVTTSGTVAGLDYAATALFALEGAALAAVSGLDLFGVLVIAVVSALGGGTMRDLLIGSVPPLSVRTSRYVLLALAGGVAAFSFHASVEEVPDWLLVTLDAGGLALFAVAGSLKGHEFGLPVLSCCFLGTLTAVGGGVLRDVLLDQIPIVLTAEIYATAALLGATVVA